MKKRVILITGPTGNLGRAVASRFLPDQPHLILIDRDPDRILETYQDLDKSGGHLLIPGIDLTIKDDVISAVDLALRTFGRIDCLIHTAGGFQMGESIPEITEESLEFMLALNLKTTLNITGAVLPQMEKNGSGKIVTIAAKPAFEGKKHLGAYSASKAAVLRITETIAAEFKRKGINANCLIPGTIDTPQNRQAMPDADTSRWVSPESLADVIYFLCSSGARDIHGAAIPVYGG